MKKSTDNNHLKYSIIVPNYRDNNINQIIEQLKLIDNSELIVIETSKQCLDNKHKGDIKYKFYSEKMFPGAARNEGAKHAKGEILVFIDSDLLLTKKAINFINSDEYDIKNNIVFGYYLPDQGKTIFSKFQNSILKYRFYDIYKKHTIRYGQSSHMIVSKENFDKIGGFNSSLRMREDTEFCFRGHIIGITNNVYDEFHGIHLKKYDYISLHKDYFFRTFYAVSAKYSQKKIFNMGSSLISFELYLAYSLSFLFTFTGIFSLSFFYQSNFLIVGLLSILIGYIIPLLLLPKLFKVSSNHSTLIGLCIFPSIFAMMFLGGCSAFFTFILKKSVDILKKFFDWIIIFKRVIWRNGFPIQIIQFATARCNLRCEHCFYKESLDAPNPGELSQEIFKQLSTETKPLLWYAFAGGEVFIRKDFAKLYNIVSQNARPKVITIPTNGWYIEKTYKAILEMLQQNPNQTLIIQLSIDGTKEIHNQIRGPNSYERAIETFQKLSPLRKIYPCFQLAFITVVTPQNSHIYPKFIDDLHAFDPNQININLFRYGYLDHPKLPSNLTETYKTAIEYYEDLIQSNKLKKFNFLGAKAMRLKEVMQKELIYKVAAESKFVTPCTAGTLSYVVWEDGRLGPCEILSDTNFNITEQNVINKKISYKNHFKSEHSRKLRKRIVETKCKCTYECAMSNNTFFSWPMTRTFLKRYFLSEL